MKKYVINSINFDNCLKSNNDDLQLLECCKKFGKLPLHSIRPKTDSEKCLCNECYKSLSMKTDDLMIYHLKKESIILERLIFSFKNHAQGCEKVFKLTELVQLMQHYDNFYIKLPSNDYKKCKRCKNYSSKHKVPNCLLNYINEKRYEEKFYESQELIKSQSTQIFKLEEKLEIYNKTIDIKLSIKNKALENIIESQPKQIKDLEVQLNNTFS